MTSTTKTVLQDDRGASVMRGKVTSIHWAGHRDVSTVAGTDRVALIVDHALGILATW